MFVFVAIVSIVFPIAGFIFAIMYFNQFGRPVRASVLMGLSLSAAFYGYISDIGSDIYRHINYLGVYKTSTFFECFDALRTRRISTVYIWDIWCWLISRQDNPFLLQASGAFVGYSILCYILFDYSARHDIERNVYIPSVIVALCITSPMNLCIGIRSANAFLVCLLAFYLYYERKKSILLCVALLTVSVLLHHCTILVIVLWMLLPIFKKYKIPTCIILGILLLTYNNYGHYLTLLPLNGSALSNLVTDTLQSAASYHEGGFNNSIHSIVSRAWSLMFTLVILLRAKPRKDLVEDSYQIDGAEKMWNLSVFLTYIAVIMSLLIGSNGSRFFMIASYTSMPMYIINTSMDKIHPTRFTNIIKWSLAIACIGATALYIYDMNWGTGSLFSLLRSCIFGYLSRLLFT